MTRHDQHRCPADAGVHLGHCPLLRPGRHRAGPADAEYAGAHRRRRRASSRALPVRWFAWAAAAAHHRFPAERSRPMARAISIRRAKLGHRHAPRWVRPHCSRIGDKLFSFPARPWCLGAAASPRPPYRAPAHAQGVATEQQLAPCSSAATACAAAWPPTCPATAPARPPRICASRTSSTREDALSTCPTPASASASIGDRNSMIGGQLRLMLQPSRGLAYVDGYLISNFLGRFDGPRWNMSHAWGDRAGRRAVRPVLGDLPGNSIGTTVVTTEREPRGFEACAHHRLPAALRAVRRRGRLRRPSASAFVGSRLDSGCGTR